MVRGALEIIMSILNTVGTDDTPVWMVAKDKDTDHNFEPQLIAWYNIETKEFLTRTTFGTEEEAAAWLKEFWHAVWQLSL